MYRDRNCLSRIYDINFGSHARDFPNFNLLAMVPEYIMHVMFEGVALYEVKSVLKILVSSELLTLNQFNNLIDLFPYRYKDRMSTVPYTRNSI